MWPRKIFRNNSRNQNFFTRHGEVLLRRQIAFSQGQSSTIRIFTPKEIQKATNYFDPSRRLPSWYTGYYWGILDDRKVVVKNWNWISEGDGDDFFVEALITEIVVLSNISHKNVVKLLGCCLEMRVPLLVYEFNPNGNLQYNMRLWIDKSVETPPLSTRLQIAIDVADALTYLHSYTSRPIVHRCVHAEAVVLDEDYTAKLAGFSNALPMPLAITHVAENRSSGTSSNMDPEYAMTGVLTEKVDTYAFGVLLLELLIGARVSDYLNRKENGFLLELRHEKEDARESPVNHVESAVFEDARREEYLADLAAHASAQRPPEWEADHIRALVDLAQQCVRSRAHERPTMREVVEELKRIRRVAAPAHL